MPEYDVWRCFTNGRTTYKCVETKGKALDQIQSPPNATAHLDRVHAANKRQAVNDTIRLEERGAQQKRNHGL